MSGNPGLWSHLWSLFRITTADIGPIYTRDGSSVIRHTVINNPSKYKPEDEFWRIICLDINRSRVSRRVSRCWAEWKPGESLNMAALVALLMKSRRTALDMAVYQRRISSVKRMFEPENSLMNFMLPFSLANLAQDRKTRSRDEIRNKKWWEDGLQNWSESQFKKRLRVNRDTFHFILGE